MSTGPSVRDCGPVFLGAHVSSPSTAGLDRRILSLAVPALGALVAEPLFVLIDSAMVGHLGATSLAGLSLASSVLTTVVGLFVFLAYATTATTARLFGAGDRRGGLRAGIDGAWLAALLGLGAAAALAAGAPQVVAAMGASGEVAAAARAYLRASAPGIPGMLIVYAATGTLRGLLDTRTPFVVAGVGAVLNAGLNAVLLYGIGMGIAGSGLGTAITQSTMAAVLMTPVVRAARGAGVGLRPRCRGLRTSLGAGAPLLVRTLSLRAAILTTVWSATAIGEVALAAHQVVTSLWTFAAFALDALAIAAQALVGNALGRADASRAADDVVGAPDRSDDAAGRHHPPPGRRRGARRGRRRSPRRRTARPEHGAAPLPDVGRRGGCRHRHRSGDGEPMAAAHVQLADRCGGDRDAGSGRGRLGDAAGRRRLPLRRRPHGRGRRPVPGRRRAGHAGPLPASRGGRGAGVALRGRGGSRVAVGRVRMGVHGSAGSDDGAARPR